MTTRRKAGLLEATILVFVVSSFTIILQLTLTRFMSFLYWNHVVYVIISFCMLGYGIASVLVSLMHRSVNRYGVRKATGWALLLFIISIPLALRLLSLADLDTVFLMSGDRAALVMLLLAYLAITLPFVGLGFLIVLTFYAWPNDSAKLYFCDLVGAAAGVVVVVLLYPKIGALYFQYALFGAGVAILLIRFRREVAPGLVGVFLLLAIPVLWASDYSPSHTKYLRAILYNSSYPNAKRLALRWDMVARVDVVDPDETDDKGIIRITNDGDAHTTFLKKPKDLDPHDMKLSPEFQRGLYPSDLQYYLTGREQSVLIIGTGGGLDILHALSADVRDIDAVEINGSTVSLMAGPFAELSGNIYLRPNVRVHVQDGRSFVANSERKYDVIHMFGVDTFAAMAQGAYSSVESYLYTTDALKDYFRHLSPRGVVSIGRWFEDRPRETLRLFVEAVQALSELNVREPEKHILVVYNAESRWGQLLMSRIPLTQKELADVRQRLSTWQSSHVYFAPDMVEFQGTGNEYVEFARAWSRREAESFIQKYPFDISPTYDDNPFFFKYYRFNRAFGDTAGPLEDHVHGYWPFLVLMLVLSESAALTLVFIFLPLARYKREGLRVKNSFLVVTYFGCLGLGFIMVEVVLMQTMSLILGHPTFSLAAVAASMLFFAGLGSLSMPTKRFSDRLVAVIASAGTLGLLTIYVSVKSFVIDFVLGQPFLARVAFAAIAAGLPAFFMGYYFPLGLRLVSRKSSDLIPWAWGVNSGFTVVGSIGAVIIAMTWSFQVVLGIAVLLYAVAAGSLLFMLTRPAHLVANGTSSTMSAKTQ